MDSSKNIQNIRRQSSPSSNYSVSDESGAVVANMKRLLAEVEGKNTRRSIFHDFHSEVPELRRSVVHRAMQSIVSSTPVPTDKRKKFAFTDSTNISSIMQDNKSKTEKMVKNDRVNGFKVPEAPPIVISHWKENLGYDSAQKEQRNTNRYNTRNETRKNVIQENKENASKDVGDRSKPSSSHMKNGTLQNCNLLTVKWPRKPSFTSKEGRKTPEAPSPAREANSSSKAIKYRKKAIDKESLEVQKVSAAKETSEIPLLRTRSKSREKSVAAWTSNSSSVSEGAPPRPPPRKKRLQRKNLSFDKQHVEYRTSSKREGKHLETPRETSENAAKPTENEQRTKTRKDTIKTEETLAETGFSLLNLDISESPIGARTCADAEMSLLIFPPDERGGTPKRPPVRLGTVSDLTYVVERHDDDGKQEHLERFIQSTHQKHPRLSTIKEHSDTKSTTDSKTDREVENERSSPTCMPFTSPDRNGDPAGFYSDDADDEGSESSLNFLASRGRSEQNGTERRETKSKNLQRHTRASRRAKSSSMHTETSHLVPRNEASVSESPGSIAEEIQRSLGGETWNEKGATAKNINEIIESPLGATVTDDCDEVREDYGEILAVPSESHTPVSNRTPLSANKTPNSERTTNIIRNRTGSNSTIESPVPVSVTRNRPDTDGNLDGNSATATSENSTGARRSGGVRKPRVITRLSSVIVHTMRVYKLLNTGPPVPEHVKVAAREMYEARTKKEETAKKNPKNATKKSTAKKPSSKKSVETVPDLTDDAEQGNTTITSASSENRRLETDDTRDEEAKSVTTEESNALIAEPSTSKRSTNYKKKKNVHTTITRATSRKKPGRDGGESGSSSVI